MACSEEELKSLLVDVGSKLEKPPSSVKGLLALLDRVEVYLSRVGQSPSKAIQSALSPTLKALVGDELLRHADVDVQVAVASCISEITRITAPEVPYDDDQMREVFQLIVSSFDGLADKSSPSYSKRTCILDTVAKVRSCVVMLDLECDGLILEMFRHFIKAIRDYHPENIFTCMESIMVRVIEESEEISSELLFCILDTVKKDNEEVTPVAHKLMKKVIETSADKLRPYIEIAMRTKDVSLSDYDNLVKHICNEVSAETGVQSERTETSVLELVDGSKKVHPAADTVPTAEETTVIALNATEKFPAGGCSDVVTSNGNAGVETDTLSNSNTLQNPKSSNANEVVETVTKAPSAADRDPDVHEALETETKASENIIVDPQTDGGSLDAEEVDEGESKLVPKAEKIVKKRGRKPKAKTKTSVPKLVGKSSIAVKELDELSESHKSFDKDTCPSPQHELSHEAAEHSSPKPSETDDVPSKRISGETGESEEKLNGPSNSEAAVSRSENYTSLEEQMTKYAASASIDASEVKATISAADTPLDKTNAPNDEKTLQDTTVLASDAAQEVIEATVDEPVKAIEPGAVKSPEQSGVPSEDTHDVEEGSAKTKDDIRRRGKGMGKASLRKPSALAAAENNHKEGTTLQKSALKSIKDEDDMTPKASTKRKRDEESKSESKDYGEELVGSKVKVWWPADKRFYKGVIQSFDSDKKRHKVLYADGEVENLLLKKQRWEVINSDEDSDTEEESDQETPDSSSGKHQKGKEANEGSSKKRLGRPPSNKSQSASNKLGRKPNEHKKSDSNSKDDSKAVAKAKTDSSKEEGKSKVEGGKKLGRPRADVSKSTSRSKTDEPSTDSAGKSKGVESKRTDKSTVEVEDTQSSGKSKRGDSKTSIKGKSDSKTASKAEAEITSIKQKGPKRKATKSGDDTPVTKTAGKMKTRESSKSKSGFATKEDTSKAASSAMNKGKSPKTAPKSDVIAPKKTEESEESEEVAVERIPSPAKATGSSKRKAPQSENRNKSGANSGKRKKGRKS
uniref:Uncharacterized protein n=1 Tax=Kalanchoe fedtschenkoi TaxID=63787 RepID=A0A7N0TA02_KALFE